MQYLAGLLQGLTKLELIVFMLLHKLYQNSQNNESICGQYSNTYPHGRIGWVQILTIFSSSVVNVNNLSK